MNTRPYIIRHNVCLQPACFVVAQAVKQSKAQWLVMPFRKFACLESVRTRRTNNGKLFCQISRNVKRKVPHLHIFYTITTVLIVWTIVNYPNKNKWSHCEQYSLCNCISMAMSAGMIGYKSQMHLTLSRISSCKYSNGRAYIQSRWWDKWVIESRYFPGQCAFWL